MRARHLLFCCLAVPLTLQFSPIAFAQQTAGEKMLALDWVTGPTKVTVGQLAEIEVPDGFQFVGRPDAGKFMELNENPSDGSELGVLLHSSDYWFVVFSFSDQGFVKDDERDLDAAAILSSIRAGTEASNKVRVERGWPTMTVDGWHQSPFYDGQTNNLTWAIRGSSEGSQSINHATRLLGRRGVMNVDLVASPEQMGNALSEFNGLLTTFAFLPGNRYSEFTRGDKVAEYGLAGLIVGGAGVALVKAGLLQKFWKLIVVGLIALAGILKQFFARLFQRPATSSLPPNA